MVVCNVGRHSRLATLLHKLGDALKTDVSAVSTTEKPRPLTLSSGAISDVEIGKVCVLLRLSCCGFIDLVLMKFCMLFICLVIFISIVFNVEMAFLWQCAVDKLTRSLGVDYG